MAMLNNQRAIVFYKSIFLSIYLSTYIYIYVYIYIHMMSFMVTPSSAKLGEDLHELLSVFYFSDWKLKDKPSTWAMPSDSPAPIWIKAIKAIKAHGEGAILHPIWRDQVQSWRDLSAQSATSQGAKGSRSGFPAILFNPFLSLLYPHSKTKRSGEQFFNGKFRTPK